METSEHNKLKNKIVTEVLIHLNRRTASGDGMKDSEGINHITFVYNSRTLTRTFMYNPREGEDGAGWWWRKEEKAGTM